VSIGRQRITKREFDMSNPHHFRKANARGVWTYWRLID